MSQKAERASGIELLRILAMMGVIFLHYNNADIGGGYKFIAEGSINQSILYLFESVLVCAVNVYVMISGIICAQRKNDRS